MRKLILVLQALIFTNIALAADDRGVAEKILASYFTDDESVYRGLLHPAMSQCTNHRWNRKPGSPPTDFEYEIKEVTEQSVNIELATGRMLGLKSASLVVDPTHEILIKTPYTTGYPEGHPCHLKSKALYTALLAQVNNEWKITTLCLSQEASDLLVKKRSDGLKAAQEKSKAVDALYAGLSQEELEAIEDGLFNIKVKAIHSYADLLGVDLTTASDVYDKACSVYSATSD